MSASSLGGHWCIICSLSQTTGLDIRIVQATPELASYVDSLRTSFVVKARIKVSMCGDDYDFDVDSVEHPYEKSVAGTPDLSYLGKNDTAIYLAFVGDQLVGQVCVQEDHNSMARVWGLRVEHGHLHHGIATALMGTVREWLLAMGCTGCVPRRRMCT